MSNTGETYMPVQTEPSSASPMKMVFTTASIEIMAEKEEEQGTPVRVPAGLIQMSNVVQAVAHPRHRPRRRP